MNSTIPNCSIIIVYHRTSVHIDKLICFSNSNRALSVVIQYLCVLMVHNIHIFVYTNINSFNVQIFSPPNDSNKLQSFLTSTCF